MKGKAAVKGGIAMANITDLSKTRYCKGVQCPKILWLDAYKPEVGENVLSEQVMKNGNAVGDLARPYFGAFSLVDFSYNKQEMTGQTAQYIRDGAETIAEAAFLTDGLYCAVDLLHRNGDGWDIIEVKSSTHLTDIYIEDIAFQYYVLTRCGMEVKRVHNLHLNGDYVLHGALDLRELFVLEDVTDAVRRKYDDVERKIAAIRAYVSVTEEPEREIGLHCENPYACAYQTYCWRHLPEHSVFDLAGMQAKTKFRHYANGIVSYEDLLAHADGLRLNEKQRRQIESRLHHLPDTIDRKGIQAFLNTLQYPLHHLDFETYQTPIPVFDGTKPYQQIPFQYSLHIEQQDGSLAHREFLAEEGADPRRALAEQLVRDIPMGACCLAYNMSFEKMVIKSLAAQFSDLASHLMNIHDNLHDIMLPFRNQSYYSTEMEGSYSIKKVLPALYPNDPELDYHNLSNVHNGSEASAAFAEMGTFSPEEQAAYRQALLKYCELDTYAMVKVLRKLREAVEV